MKLLGRENARDEKMKRSTVKKEKTYSCNILRAQRQRTVLAVVVGDNAIRNWFQQLLTNQQVQQYI